MTKKLQAALDKALAAIEDARDAEDDAREAGLDTEGLGDVLGRAAHELELYTG
ncbi:hypothetical protein [Lacticaseibacillus kribbianus]|uniref:hypothetical protein n=1 Tax=Lacticaseibacillus kribbianus TaxID=2926292 RepID=UPI001CD7CF16|nr:hypothetical protein [Lacticaseibacillus kribbianus]